MTYITPVDDSPHRVSPGSQRALGKSIRYTFAFRLCDDKTENLHNVERLFNELLLRRAGIRRFLLSPRVIFWEVDTQADFMLPDGKLYVPGAEKIMPNLNRLVEAVRQGRVFLVSSADAHNLDDPELRDWPAHCLKGTPGAQLVPAASALNRFVIPNDKNFVLPRDLSPYQQVILEKNTLDVFDNPNTDALLARLTPAGSPAFDTNPEFVIFGVVTELCVRCAADGLLQRGRRVAVVTDAMQGIDSGKAKQTLENLKSRGARLITTDEALSLLRVPTSSVA